MGKIGRVGRIGRIRETPGVAALQALRKFAWAGSRAFSQGYNIAGFQPYADPGIPSPEPDDREHGTPNSLCPRLARRPSSRPKGKNIRAEQQLRPTFP